MEINLLFQWANIAVVPAWVMLWVAPGHMLTRKIVYALWYPALLGGLYLGMIVATFSQGPMPDIASMATVEGLQNMMRGPQAFLAGWLHYLLFDLFAGMWMARDAQHTGISKGLAFFPLLFTFMLGPVGLVMYLIIRLAKTGKVTY